MRHGSLFSGIGGFDLAASWMGWSNVFQVEIDPFCQKVLQKNFPNTKRYGDIKTFDGTKFRGTVDIVTGGFPCQPFSTAGKRKGKEDDRYLWPEMLRVIREVQPTFIVGENVYGLVNWSKGMVFEQVQIDLESEGYEIAPVILPACGVNAPHKRERIWFIAYSIHKRTRQQSRGVGEQGKLLCSEKWEKDKFINKSISESGPFTNTNGQGLPLWIQGGKPSNEGQNESHEGSKSSRTHSKEYWREFPTQSPVCRRDDGVSNRVDRIKALGNAVVPQVVYQIFKAIETN